MTVDTDRMAVTWTELSRAERTTVALVVNGAPDFTIGKIVVHPTHATLWLMDGRLTRAGLEGDIVKGPEKESGGKVGTSWHLDDPTCPGWLVHLAENAL